MMQRYGLMLCTALVAGTTLIVDWRRPRTRPQRRHRSVRSPDSPGGCAEEGDSYVVKDMTGKEIRLHVDKTTKLEGSFKAGDKIEPQATEKGHALAITSGPR